MTRPTLLAMTAALLLAAGPTLPQSAADAAETEGQATTAPAISVATVKPVTLRDRIISSGLIGPVERVDVQPGGKACERHLGVRRFLHRNVPGRL